jgi:hypothetical protein
LNPRLRKFKDFRLKNGEKIGYRSGADWGQKASAAIGLIKTTETKDRTASHTFKKASILVKMYFKRPEKASNS